MNFRENESAQKLRGGYYTPFDLAQYLSRWILETGPKNILEPSCGDGVFLDAVSRNVSGAAAITAIELEGEEARKASERTKSFRNPSIDVKCADFLEWYLELDRGEASFDAVVGNPPFIRYQYLAEKDQDCSERIFRRCGLPFTKHTNAWVPFVVASLSLLRPGGRIAMVLPAEILHVLHAQSLRCYVGRHCKRIIIIDPEEIWFEGTLQGAVLFLAEKKRCAEERTEGLGIVRTAGREFLSESPSRYFREADFINGRTLDGKWTRALLTKRELDVFDGVVSEDSVHLFSDLAGVDVGMVTGANKFFLVDDDTVRRYGLTEWSHPMFGKSGHCPGVIYDERQHLRNAASGLPSNFLWFDVEDACGLSKRALDYINSGEEKNLHKRYKCRVRKPWFRVPSVYSTSVGMPKRAHDMPRLIYNEMKAYTTDTAYRIKTYGVDARKFVFCFVNSFTALSSELEGRHYGGGVLELVPSEIERLLVPVPPGTRTAMRRLDDMVRNAPADGVLECQDNVILKDLGLSTNEIACIHDSWNKLRKRRQRSGGGASR